MMSEEPLEAVEAEEKTAEADAAAPDEVKVEAEKVKEKKNV